MYRIIKNVCVIMDEIGMFFLGVALLMCIWFGRMELAGMIAGAIAGAINSRKKSDDITNTKEGYQNVNTESSKPLHAGSPVERSKSMQ